MSKDLLGWRANRKMAENYISCIEEILANEHIFSNFRNNMFYYSQILEHLSHKDGLIYGKYILEKYPHLLNSLNEFKQNDKVGSPILYNYDKFGVINPTTLRYIKFAGDIQAAFGDLNGMNLIEIGAGYGGLVNVLSKIYKFNSITLHDLPEAKKLQKKYLNQFNINPIIDCEIKNTVTENSIIISNYAWCELDFETRKMYLNNLISKCKYIFMVCYDINVKEELLTLNRNNKTEIDILNPSVIFSSKK